MEKAYWVLDLYNQDICRCSACEREFDTDSLKYLMDSKSFPRHCPNCGKEMIDLAKTTKYGIKRN